MATIRKQMYDMLPVHLAYLCASHRHAKNNQTCALIWLGLASIYATGMLNIPKQTYRMMYVFLLMILLACLLLCL